MNNNTKQTNNDQQTTNSTQPVANTISQQDTPPVLAVEDVVPPMPQVGIPQKEESSTVSNKEDNTKNSDTSSGSAAPSDDIQASPVVMGTTPKKKFGSGKVIATILGLFLLVGGLGAGTMLVQQNQDIRERASCYSRCRDEGDGRETCNDSCGSNYNWLGVDVPESATDTSETGTTLQTVAIDNAIMGGRDAGVATCNYEAGLEFLCGTGVATIPRNPQNLPAGYYYVCPEGSDRCSVYNSANVQVGEYRIGGSSGGEETPSDNPPTTPPTITATCQNVKAYSTSWTELTTAQLSALTPNTTINFCVTGALTGGSFTKARFTINGALQPETTTVRPSSTDFCQSYVISAGVTSHNVTAQIYHNSLGWK